MQHLLCFATFSAQSTPQIVNIYILKQRTLLGFLTISLYYLCQDTDLAEELRAEGESLGEIKDSIVKSQHMSFFFFLLVFFKSCTQLSAVSTGEVYARISETTECV